MKLTEEVITAIHQVLVGATFERSLSGAVAHIVPRGWHGVAFCGITLPMDDIDYVPAGEANLCQRCQSQFEVSSNSLPREAQ